MRSSRVLPSPHLPSPRTSSRDDRRVFERGVGRAEPPAAATRWRQRTQARGDAGATRPSAPAVAAAGGECRAAGRGRVSRTARSTGRARERPESMIDATITWPRPTWWSHRSSAGVSDTSDMSDTPARRSHVGDLIRAVSLTEAVGAPSVIDRSDDRFCASDVGGRGSRADPHLDAAAHTEAHR